MNLMTCGGLKSRKVPYTSKLIGKQIDQIISFKCVSPYIAFPFAHGIKGCVYSHLFPGTSTVGS